MANWETPSIKIGNAPCLRHNFKWSLTAGVLPFQSSFIVPIGEINNILKTIENPTKIILEATGGTTGEPHKFSQEIQNIYLLEPQKIDPYHVRWTVADSRWAWRGKKLYYSYNKTRAKNEKGIGTVAPPTDPASLRRPFDTFGVGRYLDWSVKKGYKPYNIKEIIEKELTKIGIPIDKNFAGDEGAYTIENVEANGVDIYAGVADLLSKSRLNLGINTFGEVYVYSVDFYDQAQNDIILNLQGQAKTAPGTLYNQDLKRIRPPSVNIRFERKVEVRVVNTTNEDQKQDRALPVRLNPPVWTQKDLDDWKVVGCVNVMPVPYPILSLTGRRYNIGEYIPIWDYIRSLTPPLSESDIRNFYFGGRLERKYSHAVATLTGDTTEANERFVNHIINTVKSHYRKTYQIDPYFADRMESWEARRVSIVDNFSHYTPPSPLFADYCVIPQARHPSIAKRIELWDKQAYNWYVNTEDPLRQNPTPGTINVVSIPLGIFQVSYPSLVDMVLSKIVHSALDPLPYPSMHKANNLLEQAHFVSSHTLDTIISVVWSVDKNQDFGNKSKFYNIDLDYKNLGGEGPEIDYLSSLEFARFPAREYREEGMIFRDPNIPVNQGILEAVAKAEGAKIINSFKDRVSGLVTLAGWVPMNLNGNMKSVTISFSGSGLETIIDMRDIPPAPTLEQVVAQKTIDYLRKHVSRADDKNEMADK